MTTENTLGRIDISPTAVATVAANAVTQAYGVVGLASKNLINGLTNRIVKDPTHGIEVECNEDYINIDLYIVVQYGTRITSVAASVANTVRYKVEKALGFEINEVNIHVQGIRINGSE